ncbi:hypothetical protein P3S68_020063 [Capsicum galapagoense]
MAKVSIYFYLLLIITFSVLNLAIAQDKKIRDLQCAAPIPNISCKLKEDCTPSCEDKYKDKFLGAGCILSPEDIRICVCGYKCRN